MQCQAHQNTILWRMIYREGVQHDPKRLHKLTEMSPY